MDTRAMMDGLIELRNKFDEGCQITVGPESVTVEGTDWWPPNPDQDVLRVQRTYREDFAYNDQDEPVDVIQKLLDRIDRDNRGALSKETVQEDVKEAPERRVQESLPTGID